MTLASSINSFWCYHTIIMKCQDSAYMQITHNQFGFTCGSGEVFLKTNGLHSATGWGLGSGSGDESTSSINLRGVWSCWIRCAENADNVSSAWARPRRHSAKSIVCGKKQWPYY